MNIVSNVVTAGVGIFGSHTFQADFLRASKSYVPGADPRLPKLVTLTGNNSANSWISVSNVSLVTSPDSDQLGYLRIGADVWTYTVSNANGVYGLANVTTANLTYTVGTLVSILGTR
jgi:hypothetical protein